MIDYGRAPLVDEIEVTLFGPGLGEAIAAHLGNGVWLLVDSCEATPGAGPESISYLRSIGAGPGQVRAIVATHWHDDHVGGMARIVKECSAATVFVSGALREREALSFLAVYGNIDIAQTGGTKELAAVLRATRVKVASSQTYIIDEAINGRNVKVAALSPLPETSAIAAAHFGKYLISENSPINKAPPEPSPNAAAVVLHMDFGGEAVLLGADLEDNKRWGWTAMVSDPWVLQRPRATAYKVSHHGSQSGDSPHLWHTLLRPEPVACLTPFIRGRHLLPTEGDRARIRSHAGSAYISSNASRKPAMEYDQLKRLNDIASNVRRIHTGLGAVRLRKKIGADAWGVELFGAAARL